MASDNTVLNAGAGGDTARDLARQAGTVKTQVVQLDLGGASANAEVLITAGQQTMAASVPVVIASNQSAVPVTPPTLTKGTQGAQGVSTQDLHNAGRNARIFILDTYTAAPVAEALESVVQWYGNAAVVGTTQPAVVPAGKTLRLTNWVMMYSSLATVGHAVVRVRINTGGLVVLASPLAFEFYAGSQSGATTTAMTGGISLSFGEFPEGFEIPAAAGIGFTLAGYGPTGTLTLEGGVRFVVSGYEY